MTEYSWTETAEDLTEVLYEFDVLLSDIDDFVEDYKPFFSMLHSDLASEGYNYGGKTTLTYLDKMWKAGRAFQNIAKAMKDDVEKVLNGEE